MPTIPTKRQEQVLEVVRESLRGRGYPPSLREIASALRLSGTRAVEKHLAALEKKGRLKRGHGSRALEVVGRAEGRSVPIVGRVAAGSPLLAEENIEGRLTLDPALARGEGTFLLRVRGQSMQGAGILDGDLVLVRPQPAAEPGEIVVALLGDEATVKRFSREGRSVVLSPENPAFRPIVVDEHASVSVVGKVVGVFRF